MPAVFLSSTFAEMEEYRRSAFDAIAFCGYQCIRMEDFPAADRGIERFCRDKVGQCDVFVLLLGRYYGTLVPGRDVSYTEDEFDTAVDLRKPILVFTPAPKADTNDRAAPEKMENDGLVDEEQRARLRTFWKKATTGRQPRPFVNPQDLQMWVGISLDEHFKATSPRAGAERRYGGERLPQLCDRSDQLDEFGILFQQAQPGQPQICVVWGHEHEQVTHCVERLECFHITYPKRGSPATLVSPAHDRAVIEWPVGDDHQEVLFNRLTRKLFLALNPTFVQAPQLYTPEAFCRLAVEAHTSYIRFRHVIRAESWGDAAASLCANRYFQFWSEVKRIFDAQVAADSRIPPRILVFFEFKHRFNDSELTKQFEHQLKALFEEHTAGAGLVRGVLTELDSVHLSHLDVWYAKYEPFLRPQFQNQAVADLFPDAPLSMVKAENRLRQFVGLARYDD